MMRRGLEDSNFEASNFRERTDFARPPEDKTPMQTCKVGVWRLGNVISISRSTDEVKSVWWSDSSSNDAVPRSESNVRVWKVEMKLSDK